MRLMLASFVALTSVASVQAAQIELRYSGVYDAVHYRAHNPKCASTQETKQRVQHFKELWDAREKKILERIRQVTGTQSFPEEDIVVYLVGCGTGISDPLTVTLFNDSGMPTDDEGVIWDLVHELFHHVARHPSFQPLQEKINIWHRGESDLVLDHVLVLAFEVRYHGYAAVARRYDSNQPTFRIYKRALALAMADELAEKEPEP